MIRKALLIGSPNGPAPDLPGVDNDLNDLKTFLLSARGGAWESHEVVVLRNPSKKSVLTELEALRYYDYVFISCGGHGEHHIYNSEIEDTVVCLNKTEEIYVSEVNPKNKRHFVVVDACRKIVMMAVKEERVMMKAAFEFAEAVEDRKRARFLFDDAVNKTTEGRIVAYSCDKNQSAGDDGSGGIFTQSLLKAGMELKKSAESVIDINEAFQYAKTRTYRLNAPQSAVLNAGRRRDYYPFSVLL